MTLETELDTTAIAAEIASDFGGGTGEELPQNEPPAEETGSLSSPQVAPPAASRPLPKSWKKEMEAHWGALPKEIHDYVYEREANVSRGIDMYKGGHENWNKLVTPYQEILSQHPNVNPVELLDGLMKSHLALSFGTPEQKREIVQRLIQEYGISLDNAPAPQVDPRVQQLEGTVRSLILDQNKRLIEAFFTNPQNKYANDVGDDILKLIQSGKAATLEEAYETAIWLNPGVRAKLIAEQQAAAAPKPSNVTKLNVGTEAPTRPGKKTGSIDDTIDAVVNQAYGSTKF
jgi:hypothetical protein